MEGVGARLGRSSNRYVPAAVFTGPVRKWKKKWVHVPPSNSGHHHHPATANGAAVNGASQLLLYRWTPTQSKDASSSVSNGDAGGDDGAAAEEPPRRKFKYIPIVVLEEQKNESSEQMEDETKPNETDDTNTLEASSKSDGSDEKPDMNDVPMDENQATKNNPVERQDLNVSTLDLSLGLAHEGDNESDSKSN